jgi:glycosyltransferase involved in cell wall biosynthesis
MPSRVEGYGLVGHEAIQAGTPVLVSGRSGLGILLTEVLGAAAAQHVVPITRDLAIDADVWGSRIAGVLLDPAAAFRTAATLGRTMAGERTWAMAAQRILDVLLA